MVGGLAVAANCVSRSNEFCLFVRTLGFFFCSGRPNWCLWSNNASQQEQALQHHCPCEDPTHGTDRHEFAGWTQAHQANLAKLQYNNKTIKDKDDNNRRADIVFVGDETVQAWDGMWFNQRCPQSQQIVPHWNRTFGEGRSEPNLKGLALGLSGDRVRFRVYDRTL